MRYGEERFGLAFDAGEQGSLNVDLRAHAGTHSVRRDQIFGDAGASPAWDHGGFLGHVEPDGREGVVESFRQR